MELIMKKAQQQVRKFMRKAEQFTPNVVCIPSNEVRKLRASLNYEELIEWIEAMGYDIIQPLVISDMPVRDVDLAQVYDGLLDQLFVTIGAAVTFGLDLKPGWEEVVRSNMSKFIDGHKREDGKWIKGPSYSPANLGKIVDEQMGQGRLL
jgi:predicted HAD superfamily Cof-like phosphohydrolase